MTVQGGGGGGRKIPPGPGSTPPAPRANEATRKASSSSPPSSTTPPPATKDGFEATRGDARPRAERPLPAAETSTPSGIDSMLRVLEETRAQILEEHRTLKPRIAALVGELVARGFDRAVLEERGAELTSLRTRMAALRRRLQQIQRRLRAAARSRGADAAVGTLLAPHLERLRTLEPGLERALVALQMMEIAFVEPWGGRSVTIESDDATAAGDALARALPGAAVATGMARLLGEGADLSATSSTMTRTTTATKTPTASAPNADSDTGRLAALRDAVKDSL